MSAAVETFLPPAMARPVRYSHLTYRGCILTRTGAAYKLAAVLGSLASTNSSAVVAVDRGHGKLVDNTRAFE